MGQALYRKYRSKNLSEIVGQDHITRTLDNALKSGKISHAYLFTGPRGVGKTSIARILAHEINGLNYQDESAHLDIIEIDAASNRRIDEIRDLREKVHIMPTTTKYKVYIIDEVHMLTKEAFNALLKTLEEPPAHVIFILATTELHKLPETIVSRTQRFAFPPIDEKTAVKHLAELAKAENIDIEAGALELLATHGHGSFRDSISLLDQVGSSSSSKVTRSDVEKIIGLATEEHIEKVLDATLNGSPIQIVSALDSLIADGVGATQVAKQLATKLRADILNDHTNSVAINLVGDLLEVSASPEPTATLEVVLFRANLLSSGNSDAHEVAQPETVKAESITRTQAIKNAPPVTSQDSKKSKTKTNASINWWQDVLTHIKSINNTLYGVLRMAEPNIDGDELHLGFNFGLHAKKVSEADIQKKIGDAIKSVTGQSYKITSSVSKSNSSDQTPEPETLQNSTVDSELESVKNIFGGGEVLES